ncbi:hypothetical protein M0638_25210 [Roseomonas sp. NAR14]|uniref:Uncharacterized protein n=1 Tax=Roseomonas acroporae TaxID=2937791 RepID=A0A9X1YEL9_9PROT|nr:hypothetical protein [Roseomonas acroporae]MCK8787670.1 hypothetical protein [Roseomonas acroporae]
MIAGDEGEARAGRATLLVASGTESLGEPCDVRDPRQFAALAEACMPCTSASLARSARTVRSGAAEIRASSQPRSSGSIGRRLAPRGRGAVLPVARASGDQPTALAFLRRASVRLMRREPCRKTT